VEERVVISSDSGVIIISYPLSCLACAKLPILASLQPPSDVSFLVVTSPILLSLQREIANYSDALSGSFRIAVFAAQLTVY